MRRAWWYVPVVTGVPSALEDLLAAGFGAELVTLDEFADLAGIPITVLRAAGGSARSAPLPEPVEFPASRRAPRWTLASLVEWASQVGRRTTSETVTLTSWALLRSGQDCAKAHGPTAARLFLAGVALVQSSLIEHPELGRWLESAGDERAPAVVRSSVRQAAFGAASARIGWREIPGFDPDVDPASDASLVSRLLSGTSEAHGSGTSAIPDRSAAATRLANWTSRAWEVCASGPEASGARRGAAGAGSPAWRFAELVDEVLVGLSPRGAPSTHRTTERLAQLLAAAADTPARKVLFEPACGEGWALVAAGERSLSGASVQRIGLAGAERDPETWLIAKARLGMRGLRHRLGEAGADALGLTTQELSRRDHDAVIIDPGQGRGATGMWFRRAHDLVAEGRGRAVVVTAARSGTAGQVDALPDEVVPVIRAVVLAPPGVGPASNLPSLVWVLGPTPTTDVLFVELARPGATARASGSRDTRSKADPWPAALDELTGLLGGAESSGRTSPRARRVPARTVVERGTFDPRVWVHEPGRERLDDARALAVHDLQRLITLVYEPDELPDGRSPVAGVDAELRGVLGSEATTEVRRALERFLNRLEGKDRRGRPKQLDA